MCYFIHLAITPQGKPEDAKARVGESAKRHKLYLKGQYLAGLIVTDGHCACKFVLPNRIEAPIPDFLHELVLSDAIKNIRVGWFYEGEMTDDAETKKLSIGEFSERNEAHGVPEAVWYRLNAPEKYHFEVNHPAT